MRCSVGATGEYRTTRWTFRIPVNRLETLLIDATRRFLISRAATMWASFVEPDILPRQFSVPIAL